MELLAAAEIPLSVISTLNAESALHLEELYRQMLPWPILAWQLQACSPMGHAGRGAVDHAFDHGSVVRFVEEHLHEAPFALGIADNIGYFSKSEGSLRGDRGGCAPFAGCSAGVTSLSIDSTGNVRGCESMRDDRFIEGNLRDQPLRALWESPDAFAYNRSFSPELLTGACAECDQGPYCAGGCRSYNHFANCGKLYEAAFCVSRNGRQG